MLLDQVVETTIGKMGWYYRQLGYTIPDPCPRTHKVTIKVTDLMKGSYVNLQWQCDNCGVEFMRTYKNMLRTAPVGGRHECCKCARRRVGKHLGTTSNHLRASGESNGRWNPNKRAFKAYRYKVDALTAKTYEQYREDINPHNHPRTLCGVSGGWQLDHVVSIKRAFTMGWAPEQCADKSNLQMLPWQDNRAKWDVVPTVC